MPKANGYWFVGHPNTPTVEYPAEIRHAYDVLLATLTPREEKILRYRLGLFDGRVWNLREIAPQIEAIKAGYKGTTITPMRVHQIQGKALRKLAHKSRAEELAPIRAYWGLS